MLTKKQLDLLEFIHKRVQRDGVPPSFDEMKDALDLRSKSGIHRLITALEERGFIRRLARKPEWGRRWVRAPRDRRVQTRASARPSPGTRRRAGGGSGCYERAAYGPYRRRCAD